MKQILQNYKTGELKVEDVPVPFLKPGGVLVQNRFSLVSAGTEKSMTELAQKSIIGKAKERPDLVKQVIDKAKKDGIINTINAVKSKLDIVKPLGYSSAGIVIQVGQDVEYCTTDYNEILNDNEIDIVIIGTRHDLHSKFVIEALRKGKEVFVEKPLAIHEEELSKIIDAWQNSKRRLMVGFNRRRSLKSGLRYLVKALSPSLMISSQVF